MKREDESYTGSTVGKKCTSNLRGSTYAKSEVKIEQNSISSWDRGFDEKGNQVWGALTGPYILRRK